MISKLSHAGAYHNFDDRKKQDVVLFAENKRYSVISLADGVSSCEKAKTGAQIACEAVTDLLLQKGGYFMEFEKEKITEFAISHILYEIRKKAKADSWKTEDYSSTVASVLYDKETRKLLFLNLGDGIIIGTQKNVCRILAATQDSTFGCCVTTTKNAALVAKAGVLDSGSLDSVIICSDGAWKNMFSGGRFKPEVNRILVSGQFDNLKEYLKLQNNFDDYSFISMKLMNVQRRNAA